MARFEIFRSHADLDDPQHRFVLAHPETQYHAVMIRRLLELFDQAKSLEELRYIQRQLLVLSVRAARANGAIRGVLKRLSRPGRRPGWREVGFIPTVDLLFEDAPPWVLAIEESSEEELGWQLEEFVSTAAVRQLRAVGDGLAWKTYDYDRAAIIALSRNQGAGSIYKPGIVGEIFAVEEIWAERGHFALMHDLTNVLRIGDLTELNAWAGDQQLYEVKVGQGAERRAKPQLRRMDAAIESIKGTVPLIGPNSAVYLRKSAASIRTHLPALGVLADAARESRVSFGAFDGRLISFIHYPRASVDEVGELNDKVATAAAEFGSKEHQLHAVIDGAGEGSPLVLPVSLLPASPEARTEILCGYLIVRYLIDLKPLVEAIKAAGFAARVVPEEERTSTGMDAQLIEISRGDLHVTLNGGALAQYLFELVEAERFVELCIEIFDRKDLPSHPILIFDGDRDYYRQLMR